MNKAKINSNKIGAFTLIELTLVAMIIGILLPSIFSMYRFIIKSNKEINARQTAIQAGYEFFERLNIMMQDYSIDYEEYYDRQMVGCVNSGGTLLRGEDFRRNVGLSGYCSEFTAYGNNNSTQRNGMIPEWRDLYYCSSKATQDKRNVNIVVRGGDCGRRGTQQSFGQYAAFFTDVKEGDWGSLGISGNIVGTDDDEELGYIFNNAVNAIEDADNIQEIYLISHDGKDRLYFRRKLANQEGEQTQYKIQMLRLKGFDAGRLHNFDKTEENGIRNDGLYDGVIDTWACDSSMGFVGHGQGVSGAYAEYFLPSDVDDCRIDITQGSTSVHLRNIVISPLGDPDLFWAMQERQINPSMRILLVNGVYALAYDNSLSASIGDFKIPLETTINMKDFYKE